jgi:hypothetical protein
VNTELDRSLIQSAISIGQEMGLFDSEGLERATGSGTHDSSTLHRRARLRVLIYIYVNQLGFRIGFSPLIPQILTTSPGVLGTSTPDHGWFRAMALWIELTGLMRTSSDLLFSSKQVTRDLVNSGRYIGLVEHFKTMLDNWGKSFSEHPGRLLITLVPEA